MENWTPTEWAAFLTALGTFVSVLLSAVAAFKANLAKIRSEANATSIAENTKLTKDGTEAAAANAKAAADTAGVAAQKTEELRSQLNGKLESVIERIVKIHTEPLAKAFDDHKVEIRNAIVDLKNTIAQR